MPLLSSSSRLLLVPLTIGVAAYVVGSALATFRNRPQEWRTTSIVLPLPTAPLLRFRPDEKRNQEVERGMGLLEAYGFENMLVGGLASRTLFVMNADLVEARALIAADPELSKMLVPAETPVPRR
jgi:hypothetical protein